jgi:hypothetical protein
MIDDDDALDRALAALPPEEPPADLHARIMAATAYAPPSLPLAGSGWELWVVVTALALAVWLGSLVLTAPHLTNRAIETTAHLAEAGGLTSITTLLWLAVGGSAAWWISLLGFRRGGRIEVR